MRADTVTAAQLARRRSVIAEQRRLTKFDHAAIVALLAELCTEIQRMRNAAAGERLAAALDRRHAASDRRYSARDRELAARDRDQARSSASWSMVLICPRTAIRW